MANFGATLPPLMNAISIATPTAMSLLTSSSSEADLVQQMGIPIQYVRKVEERREVWVRHRKEATWQPEQQLESEKARRRREKTEKIEANIRSLREEEMEYISRMEGEYMEQSALQRDRG